MSIYQQYMYSYPHKTAYRPVKKEIVLEHLPILLENPSSLYVHLPFCQGKCGYCNLFSIARADEQLVNAYLAAVKRQVAELNEIVPLSQVTFNEVVFGGGTPVYLSIEQLENLAAILASFGAAPDKIPSVIELSPNQTDNAKLDWLYQAGFKRVSVGIQSFVEEELKTLRRLHQPKRCHEVLEAIAQKHFESFNLDLIYGIPYQTEESFLYSLEQAVNYQPTELFIYPLYIKPQTPLYGQFIVEESKAYRLYQAACDFLTANGWRQQSMRRFTKKEPAVELTEGCGFDFNLALGCGGRSYLGDLHICEPYQVAPNLCRDSLKRFVAKTNFFENLSGFILDTDEQKRRYGVKNLLCAVGIPLGDYQKRFHCDCFSDFPFLTELVAEGLAVKTLDHLCLTPLGMGYSDKIGPRFISQTTADLSSSYWRTINGD